MLYLSVFASEASRSLSGSSALLYLCHEGIYKSREGLKVITVLRPTTAACAVPSLDAHLLPVSQSDANKHQQEGGLMQQPTRGGKRESTPGSFCSVFLVQTIVRAAWALGSFHHLVLLPSLHGQEVLPCHVKHMNTAALAICRTWKSALLQESAAKQFPNPLFFFLLHLNVYHCIM